MSFLVARATGKAFEANWTSSSGSCLAQAAEKGGDRPPHPPLPGGVWTADGCSLKKISISGPLRSGSESHFWGGCQQHSWGACQGVSAWLQKPTTPRDPTTQVAPNSTQGAFQAGGYGVLDKTHPKTIQENEQKQQRAFRRINHSVDIF